MPSFYKAALHVSKIQTVAFSGIDVTPVEVQVHMAPGLPSFLVVGLPDKAIAESRERVRAAIQSLGLVLPAKRIIVNLAPAASHFSAACYQSMYNRFVLHERKYIRVAYADVDTLRCVCYIIPKNTISPKR